MTDVSRRLLSPLVCIASSAGLPDELLVLPRGDESRVSLATVLECARRLEIALGGADALLDAATTAAAWPELVILARQAGCPYELAHGLWGALLPNALPSLSVTWDDRGPDHFVVRARLRSPDTLRDGLGTVLAGATRAVPLFFDGGPAHMELAWEEGTLSLTVTLPPHVAPSASTSSTDLLRPETLEAIVGLLDDRARYRARRVDLTNAVQALGDGLATARSSEDAAALAISVLTQHLRFSQALLWAGPTPKERRLLASSGTRLAATRVLSLPGRERSGSLVEVGLLEVDAGGDLAVAETLLPWIGGELSSRLAAERGKATASVAPRNRWALTPRQTEVAGLVADGLANKEIALALACSTATVEDHLTAIYRKVGVTGRGPLLVALLQGKSS